MPKLVLFDIDGTLFLNEEPFFWMENRIARDLGSLPVSREWHRRYWHEPEKARLAVTFPDVDPDLFFSEFMERLPVFVADRQVDVLSEENARVLETLKKRGKFLGVLTSRTADEIALLPKAGCFDAVYHAGNLGYLKPDPRAFCQALKHFRVDPQDAVYVGNLVSDGVCAKEAGLDFIALLEEGILEKEDFNSVGVDYFADKFDDILNYIK